MASVAPFPWDGCVPETLNAPQSEPGPDAQPVLPETRARYTAEAPVLPFFRRRVPVVPGRSSAAMERVVGFALRCRKSPSKGRRVRGSGGTRGPGSPPRAEWEASQPGGKTMTIVYDMDIWDGSSTRSPPRAAMADDQIIDPISYQGAMLRCESERPAWSIRQRRARAPGQGRLSDHPDADTAGDRGVGLPEKRAVARPS